MLDWEELERDEQINLLIEYGDYLDGLPPTCSMETKEQRLRAWLAEKGIDYAAG
ncbi:MAG: hypothetical protein ACQETD_04080 [Pseudomonadota bacterium]